MSIDHLFPPLPKDAKELLERFDKVLAKGVPMKAKHRNTLKYAIKDMSRGLTEERSDIRKAYMNDPRSLNAYLYYFLPWNLFRLTRLFTGLNPEIPGNTVLDLGSGPLTAVMALWMAKPELRKEPLTVTCMDKSLQSMKTGLKLLNLMADGKCNWNVKLVKASFMDRSKYPAGLVMAANALNELNWTSRNSVDQARRLANTLKDNTTPEGRVLLVETGTRLTGRIIPAMRNALMDKGLFPRSPCPHLNECPMPGLGRSRWCHFNLNTKGAPKWLREISRSAGMGKQNVSLNFLYHSNHKPAHKSAMVRAVSEPFSVQGGTGQYACSKLGLSMIKYKDDMKPHQPGYGFTFDAEAKLDMDFKTKAVIVPALKPKTK